MTPAVAAILWAAFGAATPDAGPDMSCVFHGRAPADMELSRANACRAVLEGIGEDRNWSAPLAVTISFAPPATATISFGGRAGHAPISIAISEDAILRRDFITLGRTIALLLQAY